MSGYSPLTSRATLYPALQRLKRKGWVRSEWRITERNRRTHYNLPTGAGRWQLATERGEWEPTASAVNRVLNWVGGTK